MEIVTNSFKFNTYVDYAFQHRYRSKDISFIFKKEIFMAFLLLIFSSIMNLMYGVYFRRPAVYFYTYINDDGELKNEIGIEDA